MAVSSTMLDLGTQAPDFALTDVISGRVVGRDEAAGEKGLLVMFICNHCPYVRHIGSELARFSQEYRDRGLGMLAISSNDVEQYPDDSPPALKQEAEALGYAFPYLYDEDQSVAKAFTAMCTPDFFLFDSGLRLVYRGRFDDSRPHSGTAPTGSDLRAAVDALLSDRDMPDEQHPSVGCSIKWQPGNEPAYFGAR